MQCSAHFIHEERGMIARLYLDFAPRVGDELRFQGEKYYKVSRIVWVYDEPESRMQRVNIGLVDPEIDK